MNAVIYARYSSENQREESIEGQEHPVQRCGIRRFFHSDRLLSKESFDAAVSVYTTHAKKSGPFEEFTLFSLHFQESMIE